MPTQHLSSMIRVVTLPIIFVSSGCTETETTQDNTAKLGGPCLHEVYCEPGLECVEGLCIIFRETDISDAGNESDSDDLENTDATIADAGQVTPDLFEVCRPLLGTWNILIESNGEPTCGQNPATQPYVVSLDAQGELQAVWNTTAGADEYEMTSEFILIDGRCALKNDSVFIIHAPPMNDIPATDIQADYHYTVIADGTNLEGSGIFHTSSTIVTTGEAQQDCTQDIAVSGTISLE